MTINFKAAAMACAVAACFSPGVAQASGLFDDDIATVLRTETFSIEASTGYLHAASGEYVYNGNVSSKLSQLDWRVNAVTVGGRIAFRPMDWLTIRARGWSALSSDGEMQDYDWFAGYYGQDSWTHRSDSPKTNLGKAWQGDVSLAATLLSDGNTTYTGILGYRHYDVKYKAVGGSYIYSNYALFDNVGTFPNTPAVAYRQVWDTPYLGFGMAYSDGDWSITGEVIGSPFVMARSRDYHAMRQTLFTEDLAPTSMVGVNAGVEYRFSSMLSLTARAEYQKFLKTTGSTTMVEALTNQVSKYPKPAGGADAETVAVSIGVKARL